MTARICFSTREGAHLGLNETRLAFISYLLAKKLRGTFIYRLGDAHQKELEESRKRLSSLEDLQWLNLSPDESPLNPRPKYAPYAQCERIDIYRRYIESLLAMGAAYERASPKEKGSSLNGARPAIYLKMTGIEEGAVSDLRQGRISSNKLNFNDWLIVDSSGQPSYDFAAMIDDHLMDISHLIFDANQVPNWNRYVILYRYFHWHLPLFLSLPPLKIEREDTSSHFVEELHDKGYLSEAVCNYLFALDIEEISSDHPNKIEAMIADFDVKKIHNNHRLFDIKTLRRINSLLIKKTTDTEYAAFVRPFIQRFVSEKYNDDYLLRLAVLFKQQITHGLELWDFFTPFLEDAPNLSPSELQLLNLSASKTVVGELADAIGEFDGEITDVDLLLDNLQHRLQITGRDFYLPVRLLLTRMSHGAELGEIIRFLGKDEVLLRLRQDKD
ncbi:MAG: glutamate--tRNA ligase family protein [Bacilli bacterium]|jgi:nondiscriminating glutamyl-tRNA synthetase